MECVVHYVIYILKNMNVYKVLLYIFGVVLFVR